MKTLILVGNRLGLYARRFGRELAKVWVDQNKEVHVEALGPAFRLFAWELEERLSKRLENPNTPVASPYCRTLKDTDGSLIYGGFVHISRPGDEDFLETLLGDLSFFDIEEDRAIAGFMVDTGVSRIVDA